ncbi:hypothetical protein GCM10011371_10850 [Novosphingobium marinum]|uniref:Uncharacterized protein n=1 Tax=Novosphingobium marinum TaxID=1514948 RepID=A0A7Z0BTH3_9SPHN|nr:hypothetical protein [Novosphingobium marinum]NYH95194.1 hypothetical protein [Novosphingobium marinum]GGC25055.1 hypothetical protein GCM10011371_10850 [Novosphingobium marinum]
MPERQSRHPDNDLIDRMTDRDTPDQAGSAGGNLQRDVGKRAEKHHVKDADPEVERVRKSDEAESEPQPKTNP